MNKEEFKAKREIINSNALAKYAVNCADALIKRLKE